MSETDTPARPAYDEPRARFRDLLAAEWLRFRSLRSTRWGVLLSAVVVIGMNVNAAFADYRNWPHYDANLRHQFVPGWAMNDAFSNGAAFVLVLTVGTLGALTIVSDYASGLARTTFAAVPARRSVVTAKAAVLTAVMTTYGAVVSVVSFLATQAILAGRGAGLTLAYPEAGRAVVASALLAPVCALVGLGLGLGAAVRHTAGSVVAAVAVLLLLPNLIDQKHRVTAAVVHALPLSAWQRLSEPGVVPFPGNPYPATVPASWLVYGVWALAGVVAAVLVVHRRDL